MSGILLLPCWSITNVHSWCNRARTRLRLSCSASVSCAVTEPVHNMKVQTQKRAPSNLPQTVPIGLLWTSTYNCFLGSGFFFWPKYIQNNYCMSELLSGHLFLGARLGREDCCKSILFAPILGVCHSMFGHASELGVCMRQLAMLGEMQQKSSLLGSAVWIKRDLSSICFCSRKHFLKQSLQKNSGYWRIQKKGRKDLEYWPVA